MCSEPLPKQFEKTTEVLPIKSYGLSTADEFRRVEEEHQHLEWLKKAGLSNEELKMYQANEAGTLQRIKIEADVLKKQLKNIYSKIKMYQNKLGSSECKEPKDRKPDNILEKIEKKPHTFYPEGHPMNRLKEIEENLFGHFNNDAIPLTKRRKIMRRLERKRERIIAEKDHIIIEENAAVAPSKPGSLWDVKELRKRRDVATVSDTKSKCGIYGPMNKTMYTIKDNKIVRLEPVDSAQNEFRAVDIVMPVNQAEQQLLEGTKMALDDIMKIDRFKDYKPGVPSKVLYLKNIASSVNQEQLSLLFNQFVLDNGGPIDVRLMSGRMRGQAFVSFNSENLAIQALDEIHGTIMRGQPIIAQFGRNSNRVQIDENR